MPTVAELNWFESTLKSKIWNANVRTASNFDDSVDKIETADIVISQYLPTEKITAATNLKWIQATSAGVEHYDFDQFRDMGVALTTASGIHAQPIAEQILGYMLVFERRLHRGMRQQAENRWENFRGGELAGKTLGIIGTGAIGKRTADLANAFDITVIGTRNNPTTVPDGVSEIFGPDDVHTVFGRSDYVVLACPLTDETHHLIGIKELSSMKSSAVLINVARGAIVNESHLITALQNGDIRGAALDVTEIEPLPQTSPLWSLSNVLVTPHMAGSTPLYLDRIGDLFADNYRSFVKNGPDTFTNRVY